MTECYIPKLLITFSENRFRIRGFLQIAFMGIHIDSCKTSHLKKKNPFHMDLILKSNLEVSGQPLIVNSV